MILKEETIQKFGYDPTNFTFGSQKKVVASCDRCNSQYVRQVAKITEHPFCTKCNRQLAVFNLSPEAKQARKDKISAKWEKRMAVIGYKPSIREKIEVVCVDCGIKWERAKHIKCNTTVRCRKCARKYQHENITPEKKLSIQEKRKNTLLEKYGVTHNWAIPGVKEKIDATIKEKYGDNFQEIISAKRAATNIERYGGVSPMHSEEIKAKYKASHIEKYGVPWSFSREEVREKSRQTNLERFGVQYCASSPEVVAKRKYTNLKRYGCENPGSNPEIKVRALENKMEKYGTLSTNAFFGVVVNELSDWLLSLGYEFKPNMKVLKGREIDLYNEELKIGIEYCGLHWHHEHSPQPRDKYYHVSKHIGCAEQGIRLITIFSDEWLNRKQQCKNFLASVIGKTEKVYARKCVVSKIDNVTGNKFINENHIQGSVDSTKICFGLYSKAQELLGVMAFAKHFSRNKDEVVLSRLCFKSGVTIVGGASKLLAAGVSWAKEEGFSKIVSWSDNRWSNGNLYSKIGFTLENQNNIYIPAYDYVSKNELSRHSAVSKQKSATGCPKDVLEHVWNYEKLGLSRIWDCGKKRWIFNL